MAYLRHYRIQSNRVFQAGDPFSLKPPRWIRKAQPGKLIRRALPLAASVVPGLGAVAALLPQPAAQPSLAVGGLPEPYLTLLRLFGYPGGDPFGGMTAKGRQALGQARAGFDMSAFLGAAGKIASGALGGAFRSSPLGGALSGALGAVLPGGAAMPGAAPAFPGMRRRSRRMNPGNTRALRRAISRVKSFTKLARSTVQISKTVRARKGRKR